MSALAWAFPSQTDLSGSRNLTGLFVSGRGCGRGGSGRFRLSGAVTFGLGRVFGSTCGGLATFGDVPTRPFEDDANGMQDFAHVQRNEDIDVRARLARIEIAQSDDRSFHKRIRRGALDKLLLMYTFNGCKLSILVCTVTGLTPLIPLPPSLPALRGEQPCSLSRTDMVRRGQMGQT